MSSSQLSEDVYCLETPVFNEDKKGRQVLHITVIIDQFGQVIQCYFSLIECVLHQGNEKWSLFQIL